MCNVILIILIRILAGVLLQDLYNLTPTSPDGMARHNQSDQVKAGEDEVASPVMANCFPGSVVLAPSRALRLFLIEPALQLVSCHVDQLVEVADPVRRNRSEWTTRPT